jgi:hypothetical protein
MADAARLSGSLYRDHSASEVALVEHAYGIWKEKTTLFLLRYAYNEYGLQCEPRVTWPSSSGSGNVDADGPNADKSKMPRLDLLSHLRRARSVVGIEADEAVVAWEAASLVQ